MELTGDQQTVVDDKIQTEESPRNVAEIFVLSAIVNVQLKQEFDQLSADDWESTDEKGETGV